MSILAVPIIPTVVVSENRADIKQIIHNYFWINQKSLMKYRAVSIPVSI